MRNAQFNEPLFSIICPVFNAAKFLDQTIQSVLNQRYDNFELILLNDGSTDNSLQICESYLNDSRIVVLNDTNHGQSYCRNIGLSKARGEYILFLDSDDLLEESALLKLSNKINSTHSDVYLFNAECFSDDDSTIKILSSNQTEEELTNIDIYDYAFFKNRFGYLWQYCIKKHLALTSSFNSAHHYCEDIEYLGNVLINASTLCTLTEVFYKYRLISSSVSHNLKAEYYLDAFKIFDGLISKGIEKGIPVKNISSFNYSFYIYLPLSFLRKIRKSENFKLMKHNLKAMKKTSLFKMFCKAKNYRDKRSKLLILLIKANMFKLVWKLEGRN